MPQDGEDSVVPPTTHSIVPPTSAPVGNPVIEVSGLPDVVYKILLVYLESQETLHQLVWKVV